MAFESLVLMAAKYCRQCLAVGVIEELLKGYANDKSPNSISVTNSPVRWNHPYFGGWEQLRHTAGQGQW